MTAAKNFADLPALVTHLRTELIDKKFVLLYAYNGSGKTRLSMVFKDVGKTVTSRPFHAGDAAGQPLTIEETQRDTLYFNAFTEDLFIGCFFLAIVQLAMEFCEASGHAAADHFRDATKLIVHGKGGYTTQIIVGAGHARAKPNAFNRAHGALLRRVA